MSNFQGSLPFDRAQAADMISGIQNKPAAASADKASVKTTSSFGSAIGLLKDKARFSSSSSRSHKNGDASQKKAKDASDSNSSQIRMSS